MSEDGNSQDDYKDQDDDNAIKKRKYEESSNDTTQTNLSKSEIQQRISKYILLTEHEKLADMLSALSERIPEVYDTIYKLADQNILCKRIYVKGISFDTTSDTFRNVFSAYGPMEDCSLAFDRITKKNKGYGFVVYKSLESVEEALKNPFKMIDGRKTQSSLAAIRDGQVDFNKYKPEEEHIDFRKIFIRNLSESTTADTLRNAFMQYGEIESVEVPVDKTTGQSKLYGFIVFKSSVSANKALRHPQKEINGRMTNVLLAAQGRAQIDNGFLSKNNFPQPHPFPNNLNHHNMYPPYDQPIYPNPLPNPSMMGPFVPPTHHFPPQQYPGNSIIPPQSSGFHHLPNPRFQNSRNFHQNANFGYK